SALFPLSQLVQVSRTLPLPGVQVPQHQVSAKSRGGMPGTIVQPTGSQATPTKHAGITRWSRLAIGAHAQEQQECMEPIVVKVGRYFINLSNLLWAEVDTTESDPPRTRLSL